MNFPKITIVTPSLNQGQFLEETIVSVIGQQYPALEYIVMDGGSTDGSIEIIRKYERHLAHWVSEADGGQTAAINRGFSRATGDILAWLNADDFYLPGSLAFAAERLDVSASELLVGNCVHLLEGRPISAHGSDVRGDHARMDLLLADYVVQPSAFWTRRAWLETGPLDESLSWGFDWEWFIRAMKLGVHFTLDDKYLSAYRIHQNQKTSTGGDPRRQELARIYRQHAGARYEQLFSRCCAHRERIAFIRAWVRRARLSRIELPILRAAFPALFLGFSADDVRNVITMI